MSNHIKSAGLVAFFAAAFFFVGCIPEDSLEWSDDGSVGLLRAEGALFLVDGQTGELTEIVKENAQPWPDISKDGNLIAYSRAVECDSLAQGLKLLPPGQVKMITYYAGLMGQNITKAGGLVDGKFPEPDENLLKGENYGNWVIRFMCENADAALSKLLGAEAINKGKSMDLTCFQVVTVPRKNLNDKRIVTTNIFATVGVRLSPDNRHVAYIQQTPYGDEEMEYSLYVASLADEIKTMLVDQRVALGYDWRGDSKAIAYVNADTEILGEDELALGTLQERVVVGDDNQLSSEPIDLDKKKGGSVEMSTCTRDVSSMAGLVFYPWLKVRYGLEGRIFFSTCSMPLPISKKDEPGWSLFCYDTVTGMVTNVLPQSVSGHTSQAMNMLQFELSPDGRKVLLPIKNNRLIDYEFGTDKVGLPVFEDEGFGEEELSALIPTFKGNNEISFLVSGKSHYFAESPRPNPDRFEVVVLDRAALKGRILSQRWPDELMAGFDD